jgi:hypothetical protein
VGFILFNKQWPFFNVCRKLEQEDDNVEQESHFSYKMSAFSTMVLSFINPSRTKSLPRTHSAYQSFPKPSTDSSSKQHHHAFYNIHTALALATLATPTFASLMVTNWCSNDVTAWQSHNGSCNAGPNGICSGQPGASPFLIPANRNTLPFPLIADGLGTSIKISNGNRNDALQYEYIVSDGNLFWDVSDIDGAGTATDGSPFFD